MGRLRSLLSRLTLIKGLAVIGMAVLLCVIAVTWSGTEVKGAVGNRFVLKPIPASAVHHAWQAPHIRNADGTSLNWSGYAIQGAENPKRKPAKSASESKFTAVTGSWVVPSVAASDSAYTYSSSWVGMDGYSDNTVEQVGTEQDWSDGTPVYYAWFEMYPKEAYEIVGFPVEPGDTISGNVEYVGDGKFELTITNVTADVSFSTTRRLKSAQRRSAEWIEEAPSWGGVLPLADFGVVDFFDCSATLNGTQTGTISDAAWQYAITMATSDGTVKAEPSALSPDGAGFSVTWEHE